MGILFYMKCGFISLDFGCGKDSAATRAQLWPEIVKGLEHKPTGLQPDCPHRPRQVLQQTG